MAGVPCTLSPSLSSPTFRPNAVVLANAIRATAAPAARSVAAPSAHTLFLPPPELSGAGARVLLSHVRCRRAQPAQQHRGGQARQLHRSRTILGDYRQRVFP